MPVAVGVMADSYKPVSGFSPLSIPWHSAFWASDPSWTPPADGAAVSSWKNSGTAASNATQATGTAQPTYRAAYTNLNGKPAIDFDGAADFLDTASPSIAQPNHFFIVGWQDATHAANPTLVDNASAGARHLIRNLGSNVTINAGATATFVAAGREGAFALAALVNGATSAVRMNGTAYTSGATVGTQAFANLRMGRDVGVGTAYYKGGIAFLGVSDTELTAQQITDLETWAKNYYGVPIP